SFTDPPARILPHGSCSRILPHGSSFTDPPSRILLHRSILTRSGTESCTTPQAGAPAPDAERDRRTDPEPLDRMALRESAPNDPAREPAVLRTRDLVGRDVL